VGAVPGRAWPEAIAKQDAFNRKYQETEETIASFCLLDVESQDRAGGLAQHVLAALLRQ
jgi:hypothetical protein